MQNASLSRSAKSLIPATVQGNLGIPAVVRQMRPSCGARGGVARQDVSAATDADANPNYEDAFAERVARRTPRKGGEKKKADDDGPKKVQDKGKERGQTLNGINENTGRRAKCNWSNSENHRLPKRPLRSAPKSEPQSPSPSSRQGYRPPHSAIPMVPPAHMQESKSPSWENLGSNCKQSLSATLDSAG